MKRLFSNGTFVDFFIMKTNKWRLKWIIFYRRLKFPFNFHWVFYVSFQYWSNKSILIKWTHSPLRQWSLQKFAYSTHLRNSLVVALMWAVVAAASDCARSAGTLMSFSNNDLKMRKQVELTFFYYLLLENTSGPNGLWKMRFRKWYI